MNIFYHQTVKYFTESDSYIYKYKKKKN